MYNCLGLLPLAAWPVTRCAGARLETPSKHTSIPRLSTLPHAFPPGLLAPKRLLFLPHGLVLVELPTPADEVDLGRGDDLGLVDKLPAAAGE